MRGSVYQDSVRIDVRAVAGEIDIDIHTCTVCSIPVPLGEPDYVVDDTGVTHSACWPGWRMSRARPKN